MSCNEMIIQPTCTQELGGEIQFDCQNWGQSRRPVVAISSRTWMFSLLVLVPPGLVAKDVGVAVDHVAKTRHRDMLHGYATPPPPRFASIILHMAMNKPRRFLSAQA